MSKIAVPVLIASYLLSTERRKNQIYAISKLQAFMSSFIFLKKKGGSEMRDLGKRFLLDIKIKTNIGFIIPRLARYIQHKLQKLISTILITKQTPTISNQQMKIGHQMIIINSQIRTYLKMNQINLIFKMKIRYSQAKGKRSQS